MRPWLSLAALLAAAAPARAEHLEISVPAWCGGGFNRTTPTSIEVKARSDLDEVDVNGHLLVPDGVDRIDEMRRFALGLDILELAADRPLERPVGDVTLTFVAAGHGWIRVEQAKCRIISTPLDVLKLRLRDIIGKPNAWAAAYRRPGPGLTNAHLLVQARELAPGSRVQSLELPSFFYRSVNLWTAGDLALFAVLEEGRRGYIVRVYSARSGGLIGTRRWKAGVTPLAVSEWIERTFSVEPN